MAVYLQGGAVLLDSGSVATSSDCCCSDVGACCNDVACTIQTASDCADSGGTFHGVGTTCDDVDCTLGGCCKEDGTVCEDGLTEEECEGDDGVWQTAGTLCENIQCCNSFAPTFITFSGTTIDCCITGSGFSTHYLGNLTGAFPLTPSGGNYVYGGVAAVATFEFFFTDDCSGIPDSTGDDFPWGIIVGCSDGTDGFPVGWHVFAFGAYGYFSAYGIVNPLSPMSNTAPCNGNDPLGNPCVGAGGTAFLS